MKKILASILAFGIFISSGLASFAATDSLDLFSSKTPVKQEPVILGNERLIPEFSNLIDGKNLGLITNQTGVNSLNQRTIDVLKSYPNANLKALYGPEHGIDGLTPAGKYVKSYTDSTLGIPVYSLYGETRKPSKDMLKDIDVLILDLQDIGSRTYTYISTLNYAMIAAKENNKKIIVLDRPNPVGGTIVEGFVLEDKYKTFVGVDNLPMAHGMTMGEIANFFNRKIGADLAVVPMKNYNRAMIYQDTNLPFPMTSPNIPNLQSAFGYMATGIGDGTGIAQADKFTWIGGKGINSNSFAKQMNSYKLPGVEFIAEDKSSRGGVRLNITDYHAFNPCKTGIYALATANRISKITIPVQKDKTIPMFEKIWGTNRMGQLLQKKSTPDQIVKSYEKELNEFKKIREQYLLY